MPVRLRVLHILWNEVVCMCPSYSMKGILSIAATNSETITSIAVLFVCVCVCESYVCLCLRFFLCTTVREFYEMCANCQQGIQHARRTRLPRVHERERLKCSLCASAVCPPCLLHIKRNVASAYEMYGWNVSVFMRWNVAQARSCCCCMCPLYGSPLPCISALMAGRDPRATNELQVMALFCPG